MTISWVSRVVIGLSFSAVALSGCGNSPESRLQGRWNGSRIDSVDTDDLSAATGWVKGTAFLFRGEQMTVEIPAEPPRSGKFEVLSYRDGKATIGVKRQDGGTDKVELKLDDERSLRWMLSEQRAIVMQRAD
jgi:hypothetical protein